MTVLTDIEQMEEDLRHRSEKLEVEFKQWMDISNSNKEGQRKIARHIAAIANHGGGRLYFGVDDDGVAQPQSDTFELNHYRSDAIHNLLKTRLDPPLQCEVRFTEFNSVTYPVIHIPRHGQLPIGARDDNSYLQIYVRGAGPETIRASTPHQWETLLKRCMRFRDIEARQDAEEDHLTRTQSMTKAITESVVEAVLKTLAETGASGVGPVQRSVDWTTISLLAEATQVDFVKQITELELGDSETDRQISTIPYNHVTMGYALLKDDLSFVTLERPHAVLRQSSAGMHDLADFGWHHFIVLPNSDGPPRSGLWSVGGRDFTGVEGMRLSNKTVYFGGFDYWRAYGNATFVICESYREDYSRIRHKIQDPFLTSIQVFVRLHSLLAHASLTISQVPGAMKIALFTNHIGLRGRVLGWSLDYGLRILSSVKPVPDRFPTELVITREELLEDYFGTLKRLCVPFLELWAGNFDPDQWFTPERIDQIIAHLRKERCKVRLLNSVSTESLLEDG